MNFVKHTFSHMKKKRLKVLIGSILFGLLRLVNSTMVFLNFALDIGWWGKKTKKSTTLSTSLIPTPSSSSRRVTLTSTLCKFRLLFLKTLSLFIKCPDGLLQLPAPINPKRLVLGERRMFLLKWLECSLM